MSLKPGMTIHFDEREILDLYQSGTLLDAIFSNNCSGFQEETSLSKCAELHNHGDINLLSIVASPSFSSIDVHRFFAGQHFYCKVIPLLNASPQDMMASVKTLIEKGGQDLAATWPNAGFTEWCSADLSRARAIIESAEADDPLAREFLPFALAAGNMVREAIRIADAYRDERRVRAIAALGRMNYIDLDSARSALDVLKRAIVGQADDILYANILTSVLGITDKAGPEVADTAAEIVKAVCAAPGPQTQYCCAYVISANTSAINERMLSFLLAALTSIAPELKGTLNALDAGLCKLLDSAFADEAITFVKKLLSDADGNVTLADFPGFSQKLVNEPYGRLHRALVAWMLSGKRTLCEGLHHLVNSTRKRDLFFDLPIRDFALTTLQKIFLCRKATGFFFFKPVIAASILVAVLRDCDNEVAKAVSDLLFDPLLINYRGELKEYLEGLSDADPAAKPVRTALDACSQYLSELRSTGVIKELFPSEHHRQIERMRLQEQSREIHRHAQQQSVFYNLVHRSVLLYGRRSLAYVDHPGEMRRPIEMELHPHRFSYEMPQMEIADPIGLDYMLRIFRAERLPDETHNP
jgi:hypothetical protein